MSTVPAPRRDLLTRVFRRRSPRVAATPARNLQQVRQFTALAHELLNEESEGVGRRIAKDLLSCYDRLDADGRNAVFQRLVAEFSPDQNAVLRAADAYRDEPSQRTLAALQTVVEPPRQELFRRLNLAPGATARLVSLRRDLPRTVADHPERRAIDADLRHLFRSWFNGGFLVLQRIDWRTSATVLERLIQYEAVHAIKDWRDLRRRLEADRRCYAFFHPALPDDPLIFIEVALTRRMSAVVQPLLDVEAPVLPLEEAACAMFYSITHCQEGLRGVSFGDLLLKQVIEDLQRQLPSVRTFATVSPIPGFRPWLDRLVESGSARVSPPVAGWLTRKPEGPTSIAAIPVDLQPDLMRLCASYLLHAKRDRDPLDLVARFHLSNGASLERLNWQADTSPNGMRQSLGIMANYLYSLRDLERNHEAFTRDRRVRASRQVERLAGGVG